MIKQPVQQLWGKALAREIEQTLATADQHLLADLKSEIAENERKLQQLSDRRAHLWSYHARGGER